jgi:hypothetical protein
LATFGIFPPWSDHLWNGDARSFSERQDIAFEKPEFVLNSDLSFFGVWGISTVR